MEASVPGSLPGLPSRPKDAHKGDFGRVLVVGGSRGMIGAPSLSANAALRAGAGLVNVAVPEVIQLAVAGICPCATSLPLDCSSKGELTAKAARQVVAAAEHCDVIAAGCGMGVSAGARQVVSAIIQQDKPVVLDADGLNNLARIDGWERIRRCPMILTPHPGEFSRLTGDEIGQIQSHRRESAVSAARRWREAGPDVPLVVVLKGAGTVVTDGQNVFINTTGNPGMATGGSGDVLTGIISALLGQGLAPYESACLGVHVHGLAGDIAAGKTGEIALVASDLIDFLPAAFMKFSERD